MAIESFVQLDVWKKAHQITLSVYHAASRFPRSELFGLATQMKRAASSIAANIAEGFGRRCPRDKARFYNLSEGSTEELKYFLILARDLGYLGDYENLWKTLEEVSRMLRRLVDVTTRDS